MQTDFLLRDNKYNKKNTCGVKNKYRIVFENIQLMIISWGKYPIDLLTYLELYILVISRQHLQGKNKSLGLFLNG